MTLEHIFLHFSELAEGPASDRQWTREEAETRARQRYALRRRYHRYWRRALSHAL